MMKIMEKRGTKWIKAAYSWERAIESGSESEIVAYIDKISETSARAAVEEYFAGWSGDGRITIKKIETGPYRGDELRDDFMAGKTIYFGRRLNFDSFPATLEG